MNDQHVPAGSPEGGQFASKGDANYASRTRRATHFDTPIKGPSGAVITHYDWKWKHEEKQIADDMKTVRVSDWDESQTNAATGREIVHHFGVTDAMGNHHTVSLETASRMLGYGKPTEMLASDKLKISAVKTLAKLKMELAVAESAHEQLKDQHSKYSTAATAAKLEMPDVKSERIGEREHVFSLGSGPMLTQSIRWGQYDSEPPSLTPGTIAHGDAIKRIKENWTSAKLRERGITEPDSLYASSASIADLKKRIERAEKKIGMNTPQTINLDRGKYGDEGHFVTIEHHVVFIKDDTGTGANGRGGSFTKHGLEKKLMKHHESRGGFAAHEHRGAMADDSGGDLMGKSRFTFHKTLPGEVRKHIENNPAARKLFRVSANAADAKGADALASMGDKYFQMADEAAGGHMTQAIESARKSDDPEARFHAAMYAELPKTKVTQGLISPDKLREGHNFTVNGRAIHVVNDNGTLTLDGGSDWPSTPVQAMSEIPIDKHSLKMGKKAMSVEKEVIPFSRTIELSQGALFDKTDKSKGTSGGQGHLYGGKSTKDRDGHDGHWVTIHGAKVFIKHGQSVGKALREHFGDSKPVTHEHVSHAAKQVEAQGGKANVEPKDKPTEPKDIVRGAAERAAQVVDPNRQLGMFAKDKDGNAIEVGEKPGQAALFHDTPKAAPVVDKAQAKRDEDAKATAEMFEENPSVLREKMISDAQALRYLAVKKIPDDMPTRAQLRVSDATTKGDIDRFLMQKYGVAADVARDASNQALTERGTHKIDGNKVVWTGGGKEPTDETHPDVASHVDSIIASAQSPAKKPETVPGDAGKIGSMHPDLVTKPTARDTIDAATPNSDEPADSYDFTRTEARDIKADAVKRAKGKATKKPEGAYATISDFEKDFEPMGEMGRHVVAYAGMSHAFDSTHGMTVDDMLGSVTEDKRHKFRTNPVTSRAANAYADLRLTGQAISEAKRDPKVAKIVNRLRGPMAAKFIEMMSPGGELAKTPHMIEWTAGGLAESSKAYSRVKHKPTNTPGSPLAGSGNANQGPVTKPSRPQPVGMDGLTRDQRKAASKPQAAPIAVHPKAQEAFDRAASSGDVTALKGMLYPENKGLRQQYEKLTGWTLPKTVKGTHEFLDAVGNVQKAVASGGATDSAMQGMNDLINKHGLKKINLSRAPDEITAACVSRAMGRLADRQRDTATLAQLLGM